MELDGLHHITMITGDAPGTVDFYADVLGLRLVKQTVNFDRPDAYHLYFGDEHGTPGSILTWFEFPGARPGRAGPGMIHTIELAVGSSSAIEFWRRRLADASDRPMVLGPDSLGLRDPDGLELRLVVADDQAPLPAEHPEIPAEFAVAGVHGVRAHPGADPAADRELLTDTLGFTALGDAAYRLSGPTRHLDYAYDAAPAARGVPGAGTVHHIAWHCRDSDHAAWRERVSAAGESVTPIIDRDYFQALYFRGPQGILFEIATTSPGFAVDEDPARLGEALRLPAQHEHLRAQLERSLTPLVNPRERARR